MNDYTRENEYDPKKHKIVEEIYRYCDENGKLLYEKIRYKGKGFRYRRPDPDSPGKFIKNLEGVTPLPYLLPKWFKEEGKIILAEGEKDADAIDKLGFLASSSPFGASYNWEEKEIKKYFKNRIIYIIYDNDDPGRIGAKKAAGALSEVTDSISIINLPGKEGDDISDYLEENKDDKAAAITRLFPSAVKYPPIIDDRPISSSNPIIDNNNIPADSEIEVRNSFLCEYVEGISKITDAPQCFILFSGLALLSAVLNHFRFVWAMPTHLNLYILLLAQSTSERKSTVIDIVGDYLAEVGKIAPEPIKLIYPSAFSPEAFFDELTEHNRGIILWRELNVVKSLFEKTYGKGLSSQFTNIWDGRPISKRFKTDGFKSVNNPVVSILCGGIGEWLVEGLKKLDFQGGLWTRFLFVPVTSKNKEYHAPGSFSLDSKILFQLRRLISLPSENVMMNIETAKPIHMEWMISLTKERNRLDDAIIETFYNKLEINALKIACLLQLAADHSTIVGAEAMKDAVIICEWLKQRLPSLLHGFLQTDWDRERQRILNTLKRRGKCSTEVIYQYAHVNSEHGLKHLDSLIKEGIIDSVTTGAGKSGHPGKVFWLI